jgi:acetyl/propionyl-CoA carboxylase alpha subunit
MNFYFLEMNTRLQVEHPVTELRTGIDLVREQVRIAEGRKLSLDQDEVRFNGHAVECRICAEDPMNNFFPSIGTVVSLRRPSGIGIREDSGIEEGSEVTPYYDPLLSKLAVWGPNRAEALNRMEIALDEYRLYGVRNNLSLCQWVINHPKFRDGSYTTRFLDERIKEFMLDLPDDNILDLAAISTVLLDQTSTNHVGGHSGKATNNVWKQQRLDQMR